MIIQRYVIREVLQTFAAVLTVLMLIYISNRFARYLAEAAAGTLSSGLIFELLALKLISNLGILIPLALYTSVLLGLGRFYKDSEIVAMVAGGIGIGRVAQAVFWMSAGLATLSLVLTLYIAPLVASLEAELLARAREESEITGIYPGRFKVFRQGRNMVYAEGISPDRREMLNVFVQSRHEDREDVIVASVARQKIEGPQARRYIVLEDGHRYTGRPGDIDYVVTRFESHGVLLDPGRARPGFRNNESYPTLELFGSENRRHQAELQWRLSMPVTVLVLAMLAIPLARTSPRHGRYAKLFTAFLIYFAYNNGLGVFRKFVERGEIHAVIGVWPVHLVMIAVVAGLLLSQSVTPGYVRRGFKRLRLPF